MYGAVGHCYKVGPGPANLGSFPSGAFGFNCGVITLGKGYVRTNCLSNQAINPFGVGKLIPAISRG